jgi:hypothetical protein
MFISNIKNLRQCGLYGAAGNLQEITVLFFAFEVRLTAGVTC